MLRLHEVGEVTTANNEVNQADDVGNKNHHKHDIEYALPGFVAARLVFLCLERGVESLILGVYEYIVERGRVIPVFKIPVSAFLHSLQLRRGVCQRMTKTCLPSKMR